ncbi:MAG: dihydroorotase [Thermoanaerobaculia bacterium]|nr:dihydroorotase [Thermoanaerobaculia bacterium]MBP9823783.1 dihydroorotase [Thermoanaerobaculia bacterium]
MRPVLLTGGRLIDPAQGIDGALDLLLTDGVVGAIGAPGSLLERAAGAAGARAGEALEVIELAGKVVCPGLIDIHVHFREPGQESKETVATGAAAAVAGGFARVACMANTLPANDSGWVTGLIVRAAELAALARVHPIGAISKGLEGKELAPMGAMVAAGAVAVSDDGRPVSNAELMRRALEYSRHFGIPVIQHAQDMDLTGDGVMHEGVWSARSGMPGIPGLAEDVMVARDLLLVEETGGRYHLAHMSTARAAGLVREAKRRGLPVTCEVTPHHLLLTDQSVVEAGFDAQFKMNPPLRADRDREALLAAIADGTVDAIASDHAPHTSDEKCFEFELAPFGILGLETTLSVCLEHLVRPGHLALGKLVELLTSGPARVLGLPGGTLAPGSPADVTVIDLERKSTIEPRSFRSKSRNTPFGGWPVTGGAVMTIVGGRVVFRVAP